MEEPAVEEPAVEPPTDTIEPAEAVEPPPAEPVEEPATGPAEEPEPATAVVEPAPKEWRRFVHKDGRKWSVRERPDGFDIEIVDVDGDVFTRSRAHPRPSNEVALLINEQLKEGFVDASESEGTGHRAQGKGQRSSEKLEVRSLKTGDHE